ncbi:MAG: hypothetical protein QOD36_4719, partial [Mycobacterium sp.]|nr:hypothetical protein [Mycobacterium sp.]
VGRGRRGRGEADEQRDRTDSRQTAHEYARKRKRHFRMLERQWVRRVTLALIYDALVYTDIITLKQSMSVKKRNDDIPYDVACHAGTV